MGAKLTEFYEQAKSIGGMKAQMRLAMLTTVSSAKAGVLPDTPDVISRFENALKQIKAES